MGQLEDFNFNIIYGWTLITLTSHTTSVNVFIQKHRAFNLNSFYLPTKYVINGRAKDSLAGGPLEVEKVPWGVFHC